ncbi:hypothetical protein PT277_05335 [Acetobacteraceae bacterium ESL0709]|nr:hypothetical protein [Acetobacteraceae bacterium ESL0697]MDF7678119.1 hypothetical protein [Acetobacteraceae bacterium ESL0709]
MPQIVTINESVIRGAQPNLLQKKGCLISLGATSLSHGESRFVSSLADLQSIIDPSSGAQVQGFSDGTTPPFIQGEAARNSRGSQLLLSDPPVAGYAAPFNVSNVVFTNKAAIAAGDKTFDLTSKFNNILSTSVDASSLSFTNLREGDAAFLSDSLTYKSKDNQGYVTFTVSLAAGVASDIAAGTEFKADIAGLNIYDNSQAITELMAMGNSWFANNNTGCWVLELGIMQPNMMGTAFANWYQQNNLLFYGYVFPRKAALDSAMASFLANQSGNNTRVYFFLCGDKDGYSSLITNGNGQKSTFYGVEYTGSVVTAQTTAANTSSEHLAAAVCAQFCSANPSAMNRLAPMSFRVLNGITSWPEAKNATYFQTFKTDNVGFAGTSNEGGIEGSILFWGNFMNGDTMSGWYGADWCSINMELQLANAIIEGSQPGINPLVYDQSGISRLAARAQQMLDSAVSAGCILPNYIFDVTSFENYLKNNPSDYPAGIYNGLAATITPVRGFLSLTYNLAVDFSGQTVTATTQTAGV